MLRLLPTAVEPETWILAFHRTTQYWLVRWLAFGRYKHVSAFAWVPQLGLWIVYDITMPGTRLLLLPESQAATDFICAHTRDADLVRMRRRPGRPPILPFYCVSAIKSLLGIRCGALLCTSLYRHCLAHGGELIHGRAGRSDADDRSGDARSATAGAA